MSKATLPRNTTRQAEGMQYGDVADFRPFGVERFLNQQRTFVPAFGQYGLSGGLFCERKRQPGMPFV